MEALNLKIALFRLVNTVFKQYEFGLFYSKLLIGY